MECYPREITRQEAIEIVHRTNREMIEMLMEQQRLEDLKLFVSLMKDPETLSDGDLADEASAGDGVDWYVIE